MNEKEIKLEKSYGKCGILSACLIDPLSQLINKISGIENDEINSVGFYYETTIQKIKKYTIILFNTYDNYPVPWLRFGYTMDLLLASEFVTKITFYPLLEKLEDIFKTLVIQTIDENSKNLNDKTLSYTILFLRLTNVNEEISKKIITGYNLVNKVLLKLMGFNMNDIIKLSSNIISCHLFLNPFSIFAKKENIENDTKYVVEESRKEITKLIATFVDMFTTHTEFREKILNISIDISKRSSKINKLLKNETCFISYIVDSIENGLIQKEIVNDLIKKLIDDRSNFGFLEKLPIIKKTNDNIKIINNTMCTFKQNKNIKEIDSLEELGNYITYITENFDKPETLVINLGTIISLYNKLIKGINVKKIKIPKMSRNTLSRSCIATLPGEENGDSIDFIIDSKNITIPMYNADLSFLTDSHLYDLLLYIDSLNENNTRYSNLLNEITFELGKRRKNDTVKKDDNFIDFC